MPFRPGHTLLAFVLAVAACVPGVRRSPTLLATPSAVIDARKSAVIAAHERLQGALDDLDSAGIAAVLDRDAHVIMVRGDTVRGDAMRRFLMNVAADRSQRLILAPARLEQCTDGTVLEYDGDFVGPRRIGTEIAGRYDILWTVREDWATVHSVYLGATRLSVRGQLPCAPEFRTAAGQQRFTFSLAALGNPFGLSSVGQGVANAMRAQGLSYASRQENVSGPLADPFPQSHPSLGGISASLVARSTRELSGELLLTARTQEIASGYDSASSRFVEITSAPVTLAALAQYQRGAVRVGIGPALLFGRFTTREEQRSIGFLKRSAGGINQSTTGNPLYRELLVSYFENGTAAPQSAASRATAAGLAADAAFIVPLTRRTLVELHLSGSAFAPAAVPSTSGFRGVSVSARYFTLGFSLSRGWE